MNPIILYLLQFIACSGILYGYYHVMLRNRTFHHYNRFYLIFAVCASLIIPLLNIPIQFSTAAETPVFFGGGLDIVYSDRVETETIGAAISDTGFNWGITETLWTVYAFVCLLLITRISIALRKIRQLLKRYPIQSSKGFSLVNTREEGTPFSFFKWLFWNEKLSINSPEGEKIFRHELYHIRNRHSWDLMFLEFVSAIAWMNPFTHLIKKELSAIHEFLADEDAVRNSGREQYAELLLMQALGTYNRITNPFFHNQIKRRIIMITNSSIQKYSHFKKLMAAPVTTIAIMLFACEANYESTNPPPPDLEKPFTVVIDAGHGVRSDGGYDGAKYDDLYEDQLTLALAKKVKAANKNKNIRILLTRNSEALVPLRDRVNLAKEKAADFFISLHINANPDQKRSGFETVLPMNSTSYRLASEEMGNLLAKQFALVYPGKSNLAERKTQVWVLDKNVCPAILVECGYLTNEQDRSFILNETNQGAVADAIIRSIELFAQTSVNNKSRSNVTSETSEAALLEHNDTLPTSRVEKPQYPGGQEAWARYIRKNANTSSATNGDKLAPGTYNVTVRFLIDKNGEVTNVEALNMQETRLAQHCEDLVKQSGRWKPALKNNVPVRAWQEQKFTVVVVS